MFDIKDKIALVTGAASGIGLACVKELLQHDLKGVALIDVNAENGQRALDELSKTFSKSRVIFVRADVSEKSQLEAAFETTVNTFKQLDIVINNAGIVHEFNWEKCIAINLTAVITGSMLAVEKYFPKYRSGTEAVVLNTASIVAFELFEHCPTYTSTKYGVIGFTRTMGGDLHYQTTKTRFVAICPGVTNTNINNITKEQIGDPFWSLCRNTLDDLPGQRPDVVAKHAVDLIRKAPTGSAWLAVDGNCTQVDFPKYFD